MTDYYVAGETGDDATGDGSSGNPYQTMTPISESAGDTIHFKENCRYILNPLSGSSGFPITYQQWSGQDQAVFNAADITTGWTGPDGNNEYWKVIMTAPGFVVQDGTVLTVNPGGAGSLSSGEWAYDLVTFRVYVKDDPTSSTMEVSIRDHGIDCSGKSWFDLIGLDVRYTNDDGIDVFSISSGNVNIIDCTSMYTRNYCMRFAGISGGTHVIDNFEAAKNRLYHGLGIYSISGTADITLSNSTAHDLDATSSQSGLYTGSNTGGTFTISNCSFYSNKQSGMYALTISGGDLVVEDTEFYSNTQHGFFVNGVTGGDIDVRRNTFNNNTQNGLLLATVTAADSCLVQYCLSYSNGGSNYGFFLANADDVEIYRCTVVDENRGFYLLATSTGCDIDGCIVYGCTVGMDAASGSSPTIDYCCINSCTAATANDATTAWAAGTGNITTDPDFLDTGTDNYHIPVDSPCMDTGTTKAGSSSLDLDGNTALHFSAPDMGCYEYQPVFYELSQNIECGIKPQTAAGMNGVLVT